MNEMIKNNTDYDKYYKHILNSVPGAMVVFEVREGVLHVRFITDYCEKISGFTPEETYARGEEDPLADAHPNDRELFYGQDWSENPETLSYTYRIICKDGTYKWVHLALSRTTEDGEVLYYGLFTDIDEEHRKEEEIKEKERAAEQTQRVLQEMYQSILDETKAMLTIIDAETFQVVYANKMAMNMSQIEGYVGCTCYHGIHRLDRPCTGCLLLNGKQEEAERREVSYGGHTYRMIKKIISWNNRKALLEYSEDITDQNKAKKAEIELEAEIKANHAKTDFLSRVSHDMRTPLNGILGITALLKDSVQDKSILRDLDELEMSGEYLLNLINDTLDISKIESGKLELHPTVCEGERVFNNALGLVKMSAKQKNIKLNIDTGNISYATLFVDVSRTQQVIMNVLSNAVKFTPNGGNIYISMKELSVEDGIITDEIVIRDTGIGISSEFLPHIFEPFSQEDTDKTGVTQGTGLGMAITKQLVEKMGGSIHIESEIEKGTCVTLIIKFKMATKEQIEEYKKIHVKTDKSKDLNGKCILLCEDHPLNTQIATRLLESRGIMVEHAENGQVGVQKFERSAPNYYDAILMDIRMPVMNGMDAARAIRALSRSDAGSVPIIAMTANAFADEMEKTKEAGMDAHLSKPIQFDLLFETLERMLWR